MKKLSILLALVLAMTMTMSMTAFAAPIDPLNGDSVVSFTKDPDGPVGPEDPDYPDYPDNPDEPTDPDPENPTIPDPNPNKERTFAGNLNLAFGEHNLSDITANLDEDWGEGLVAGGIVKINSAHQGVGLDKNNTKYAGISYRHLDETGYEITVALSAFENAGKTKTLETAGMTMHYAGMATPAGSDIADVPTIGTDKRVIAGEPTSTQVLLTATDTQAPGAWGVEWNGVLDFNQTKAFAESVTATMTWTIVAD